MYHILYGPSPLSPLVKSLVRESQPPLVEARGRTSIMHKVSWGEGGGGMTDTTSGPQWGSLREQLDHIGAKWVSKGLYGDC